MCLLYYVIDSHHVLKIDPNNSSLSRTEPLEADVLWVFICVAIFVLSRGGEKTLLSNSICFR